MGIGIFRIWYAVTDDKHYGRLGVGGIGELVTFFNDHELLMTPCKLKYFLLYRTIIMDSPQFRRLKRFAPDVSDCHMARHMNRQHQDNSNHSNLHSIATTPILDS
jgi:hypothetical protein